MSEKTKKIYIIVIITILVFALISTIIFKIIDKKEIPQIDYDTEEIVEINNDIKQLYQEASEDENTTITYDRYSDNNYLSIVFKIKVYDSNFNNQVIFYSSYVVDRNTKSVLTNEEIMNIFGYNFEKIEQLIDNRLYDYYQDEVSKNYINKSECDFNCYKLNYREIQDLSERYTLSIENNKLVIYIDLNSSPTVSDLKYFSTLNFNPNRIEIN